MSTTMLKNMMRNMCINPNKIALDVTVMRGCTQIFKNPTSVHTESFTEKWINSATRMSGTTKPSAVIKKRWKNVMMDSRLVGSVRLSATIEGNFSCLDLEKLANSSGHRISVVETLSLVSVC
jgi:hypothetical protein